MTELLHSAQLDVDGVTFLLQALCSLGNSARDLKEAAGVLKALTVTWEWCEEHTVLQAEQLMACVEAATALSRAGLSRALRLATSLLQRTQQQLKERPSEELYNGLTKKLDLAAKVLEDMHNAELAPPLEAANQKLYTMLMTALGKQWRPDEALQVFERMQAAGIRPNLIAYNAIVSAVSKDGRWETALDLLESMTASGLTPNLVTYNSVISACGLGQQWQLAAEMVRRANEAGLRPDVYTYNALLGAYARGLQWERADKLLRHMRAAGVKANRVTYNTRIALCGGMGQWERTLELLEEMKAAGIKPDLVTYNTLIFACGKGQQWEKASAVVVAEMEREGVAADQSTYNTLMAVCAQHGRWEHAIQVLEAMQADDVGIAPNRKTFNLLLTALWAGEQFPLAVAMYERALQLRVYPTPQAERLELRVLSPGAALAAVSSWLALIESTQRPCDEGGDASGAPATFSVVLGCGDGKDSKGNAAVQRAVRDYLQKLHSPFAPSSDVWQPHVLQAPRAPLLEWLQTLQADMAPAVVAAGDGGGVGDGEGKDGEFSHLMKLFDELDDETLEKIRWDDEISDDDGSDAGVDLDEWNYSWLSEGLDSGDDYSDEEGGADNDDFSGEEGHISSEEEDADCGAGWRHDHDGPLNVG